MTIIIKDELFKFRVAARELSINKSTDGTCVSNLLIHWFWNIYFVLFLAVDEQHSEQRASNLLRESLQAMRKT